MQDREISEILFALRQVDAKGLKEIVTTLWTAAAGDDERDFNLLHKIRMTREDTIQRQGFQGTMAKIATILETLCDGSDPESDLSAAVFVLGQLLRQGLSLAPGIGKILVVHTAEPKTDWEDTPAMMARFLRHRFREDVPLCTRLSALEGGWGVILPAGRA